MIETYPTYFLTKELELISAISLEKDPDAFNQLLCEFGVEA